MPWARRRNSLSRFSPSHVISSPSKMTRPAVGLSSRRHTLPSVVFPLPESPTRATVSRLARVRETPLSAPVSGYPMSYAVDGKQYVAVGVGGNSTGVTHLATLYPELRAPNGSNILMVFALGD